MAPGTALALFLLGIAAALRLSRQSGHARLWLSTFAAAIALLIGLAMIALYALDLQTDLNHLLGGQGEPYAHPSSPPTAITLILLAASILFYDARPPLAAWLVLYAGLISITALLAFLFGATPLYQLPNTPSRASRRRIQC